MTTYRSTTAAASSLVVSKNPAKLFKIIGFNDKASAQYIQVHDAASLPANTAVPKLVITAGADSNFEIDLGDNGCVFETGIVICNSSTMATKTLGSADCFFFATVDARDSYYGNT